MNEETKDVAVAVTYNPVLHEFLLLRRAESRNFPGCWEFPAGNLEEDESPKRASRRELKEETGLSGQRVNSGEPFEVETEYGRFRVHPFLYTVEEEEVELSKEHSDYRWVLKDEIDDLETIKDIEMDLEAVGIE